MKPEDVPDEWVWQLAASLDHPSVFMGGPSERNKRRAREALAAVLPLAVAEERAECAKVAMEYPVLENETAPTAHARVMQGLAIAVAIRSRGSPR